MNRKSFDISALLLLCAVFMHILIHESEGCDKGHFRTNGVCKVCPLGTYQEKTNRDHCKSCPSGYTTQQTGSIWYYECQIACGSGFRSKKVGLWYFTYQCVICPQGSYSDSDRAGSCTQCPHGQITSREGSTSASDCLTGRTCVNGCPPLSVLFGEVSYNRSAVGGRYPVGTRGTYECDDSKKSGSTSRICQQSGVWNGSPAICRRTCQPLSEENRMNLERISYRQNNVNGRYRIGNHASYECNNGYAVFRGWTGRTCRDNGQWDGFPGDCAVGCGPIWGDNAHRSYDRSKNDHGIYTYGTKATSICEDGYEFKTGWRVRTCQSSGEWDGWPYICE